MACVMDTTWWGWLVLVIAVGVGDTTGTPGPTSKQRSRMSHRSPRCGAAIPLPLFVGWRLKKSKCECGDVFKTMLAYREHYVGRKGTRVSIGMRMDTDGDE